ncbi:MAG: hydroxymyristoyl-ACP dehydratase [Gemmataceae bacterium]|nr:hydroxymyristoyl-ACP dehydratase [Gemmataceae bacterium]
MRFNLVDRILEVDPRGSIRAYKQLTLGEEYLADHFPTFPVMPGVLMLQTLVETAAWFLRVRDDFKHSVITLREAKNVKYGTFMEPGRRMMLSAELVEEAPDRVTFKGKGEVEGAQTVSARFTVGRYNLRDRDPAWHTQDTRIVDHLRCLYVMLRANAQNATVAR